MRTLESRQIRERLRKRSEVIKTAFHYLRPPTPTMPDTPLTREAMLARETKMMDQTNIRTTNESLHTVPSAGEHYDGWGYKWDEDFAIVINARRGKPEQAAKELRSVEQYRDKRTGFLSNKFRIKGVTSGDGVFLEPERRLYNHRDFSSYTQPPIKGWAVWETYQSYRKKGQDEAAEKFLRELYGTTGENSYTGLQGECAYFINYRQTSDTDPTIFNVHPNETGRDYDPALGPKVKKLPGKGRTVGLINSGLVWAQFNGVPKLKERYKVFRGFNQRVAELGQDPDGERLDWLPEQVREFYAVNDAMFNAMHVVNLRYTAKAARELARLDPQASEQYTNQADGYEKKADAVEQAMIDTMWNPQKQFFYNTDKEGNKIPVESITGLFPLLLEKLPTEMAETLLDRIQDEAWSATPFPIPSHPRISKHYDPHYFRKEGPDWKGPVWVNVTHVLTEEGLVNQAKRFLDASSEDYDPALGERFFTAAKHIADRTQDLLASNELVYEQNDPEGREKTIFRRAIKAGMGQRVEDFMWPNIGLHFHKVNELENALSQ